ncbi:MAG TPA: efflux RND transporter permease subunit, partial [Caulobacteraceae bacterium]
FLPMAFFGGSTGAIYRQFSITIVSAMVLSVLVALVLTPALCASFLKPVAKDEFLHRRGFFGWFNRSFATAVRRYEATAGRVIGRPLPALILYGVLVALMAGLFIALPTAFLPEEDQGFIITSFSLPPGAIQSRAVAVALKVEHYFLTDEAADVDNAYIVTGFGFGGQGQNQGIAFVHLKPFKDRRGASHRAQAITERANRAFSKIRDAQVFALTPPAVSSFRDSAGFDLELEDQAGLGHAALIKAKDELVDMAAKDPLLTNVRFNGLDDTTQLHIDIDKAKATALGLNLADVNETLSAAWGGSFVNNFIDRGRVKQVYMQADAPFRSSPQDIGDWFVRGAGGAMTPLSAVASWTWIKGPAQLQRYNGVGAVDIQGQPAPGQSSGAAMNEMQKLVSRLPLGIGYEWTGISYQEKLSGSQAPALYGISILVVFLCLAALYESWSIPLSVMLVIPLGVVGALLAATLRGFYNDVYFQVGLLTTIGLSAKNAILIVQFAEGAERRGAAPIAAAMEAARLRLRPIIMTSLAFIAGVFPLAIATGAGAGSQNDIGTGVIGGMLSATVLAIFFVPMFFVGVRSIFRERVRPAPIARPAE